MSGFCLWNRLQEVWKHYHPWPKRLCTFRGKSCNSNLVCFPGFAMDFRDYGR
jgi:hypothetical protein